MKINSSFKKCNYGFTLVELIVVLSTIVTLMGFIVISLANSQQRASITSTTEILLSDLKQQQMKSMIGDTEGRPYAGPFGAHFELGRYVLFHGPSYDSLDSSNFTVDITSDMRFNTTGEIIFSRVSGEISLPAIIELQDNTNSSIRRIHLNAYGAITEVESI